MHPRPLNEKGGNDSMCASIGQQTKEQTTHWSKLQAIRLERERVRMWSQPTIHLIPKCKEQLVKCKRGSSYQCGHSHPMTAPHLGKLSPCTKRTKCNESKKENKRVMWSQPPTDLHPKYKEYKV